MAKTTEQSREPTVMSDEEWNAARRDAMGSEYPGDAEMRRRDAEDDADMQRWTAEQTQQHAPADTHAAVTTDTTDAPAHTAEPAAKDWNAHDWVQEAFKSDPHLNELSAEDRGRLDALADEKHGEYEHDVKEWADEKVGEWKHDLQDRIVEGLDANASTHDFVQTRLADGDFSADDKAALESAVKDMTPQEQVHLVRPIIEEVRQMDKDVIDGAEMIIDHAIDDVKVIVDARAEMPNGDSPEIHKMQQDLEEAPDKVHEGIEFVRHDHDAAFDKVDAQMDAIEGGADPRSLHDHDTYQVDDNAHEHEMADA